MKLHSARMNFKGGGGDDRNAQYISLLIFKLFYTLKGDEHICMHIQIVLAFSLAVFEISFLSKTAWNFPPSPSHGKFISVVLTPNIYCLKQISKPVAKRPGREARLAFTDPGRFFSTFFHPKLGETALSM